MSRYLDILSTNRPFNLDVDENNRKMFAVNFDAVAAAPVEEWEDEVAKIIEDAGLGTRSSPNRTIFIGRGAVLPTGDGPYITILDSGGVAPLETHNSDLYERLSCEIIIRAKGFQTARTRALAIWRALDGVRDQTVTA